MTSVVPGRPQTTRPRGICKYYSSPGGCLHGQMCKFLHGTDETLSPYDKSKTCKFYASGFCKRGDQCWFRHVSGVASIPIASSSTDASTSAIAPEERLEASEEDDLCCVCQEKPITYGLLTGCSHICCLQCLRGWRDSWGKAQDLLDSGNTKKCPYCRTPSLFVTPSSVFFPSGHPRKDEIIQKYKSSMARVPCKHFEGSRKKRCPFGRDCFYQHKDDAGNDYIFPHGAGYYMSRSRQERGWSLPPYPDYEAAAHFAHTLREIRQHLAAASSLPSAPEGRSEGGNDAESYIGNLMDDVLTSLEGAMAGNPASMESAMHFMASIFTSSDEDEDDNDESDDDDGDYPRYGRSTQEFHVGDNDEEQPPPLEPYQSQTASQITSALPRTRAYMTSVSASSESGDVVVSGDHYDADNEEEEVVAGENAAANDGYAAEQSRSDARSEQSWLVSDGVADSTHSDVAATIDFTIHTSSPLDDRRPSLLELSDPIAPQPTNPATSSDDPHQCTQGASSIQPQSSSHQSHHLRTPLREEAGDGEFVSVPEQGARAEDRSKALTPVTERSPSLHARKEVKRAKSDRWSFITDGRGRVVASIDADADPLPVSPFWSHPHTPTTVNDVTEDSALMNGSDCASDDERK